MLSRILIGEDKMGNEYQVKEKIAQNKIESLISKMADYLNCEEDDIKILRIRFFNGLFSTHFSIRFINHRKSSLRRIVTSIYYFDIGGEYVEREGIWYEGVFYTYDSLEPFFEVLKLEIEEKSIIK
ncbi:MAG: hypothetical protein WB779_08960 [Ignavibacteriaceae bacterium]